MNFRRWLGRTTAVALGLTAVAPAGAGAAAAPTRYTLANGCYALQGSSGQVVAGGDHVRMQATTLGSYLLYRPDHTFLATHDDGSVAPDRRPSPAADWRVTEAPGRTFTLSPASSPGRVLTVRFVPAQGCAVFPDAELNATGAPRRGEVPYGRVGGIVEGHMHWMTFEYFGGKFHCGRPWHPYGIEYALPDCSSIEGPQGTNAPFQNTLNYGNPAQPHDTSGYPQLTEWSNNNLTYEGTYWRWIERAYLGGLRLMVMGINENRVLCELQ